MLDAHLQPRTRVLDLGGGPGRYAAELARRGHRVVLVDPVPEPLETARAKLAGVEGVESIDAGDARDLRRHADASFGAVLAFGPFYHLVEEGERRRAAAEMARVLVPGGLAFVATITSRISPRDASGRAWGSGAAASSIRSRCSGCRPSTPSP